MIVYFSFRGTTRKYAEHLSAIIKDQVFELREKKKASIPLTIAGWVTKSILKLKSEAEALPDIDDERIIYICSPIYAGDIPPVVRYFIDKSNLEGKKVNLILLCQAISNSEKYKQNVINNFAKSRCKVGFAHVFASVKGGTDDETISDQLSEIVLNLDKAY